MKRTALWACVAIAAALAPGTFGQDSDRDGITDDNELMLGTDPEFAEPLTLLLDDKAKGQGDATARKGLSPCRDFTKLYFAPVAKGRYLWRIDFVEPFDPSNDNVFILYMDVDGKRETGRQDKPWARGVDVMFRPKHLQLIGWPRDFRPGWASAFQGKSMYLVADLPLLQRDGKSVMRMYLLCQDMREGRSNDADITQWFDMTAPGESSRPAKPWAIAQSEGVTNWHMTRRAVRGLIAAPGNVALSPKACTAIGFEPDERIDEVSGGRTPKARLSFACPKPGRYHLAWVMMNYSGQTQAHVVYVDGTRRGIAVCDELGRRQQFFAMEKALEFTGKERIELRPLRYGSSFRFRNILFLKQLPKRPALAITHLLAQAVPRAGRAFDGRLTWITNRACTSVVHYGPTPAYGLTAANESFVNNHRVVLPRLPGDQACCYRVDVTAYGGESMRSQPGVITPQPPARPTATVAGGEVPLTVRTMAGDGEADVMVSSGVPLPAGHLESPANVRLVDAGGAVVPVQTKALATWPDGTVKWLHLVFPSTASASRPARLTLHYGRGVRTPPAPQPIRVQDTAQGVTISTGPLTVKLSRQRFAPPGEVWLDANANGRFEADERIVAGDSGSTVALRAEDGTLFTTNAPPDEVVVEEAGPLRACVRIRGRHRSQAGAELFAYTARVYAYAGKAYVRVFYTFGNDNLAARMTKIRGIDLTTRVQLRSPAACAFGPGAAPERSQGEAVELYHDYEDHFRVTRSGRQVGQGQRAAGWARLSDRARGMTVSVRNFWQLYPKAFRIGDGSLDVRLLPPLDKDQYAKDKELEDRLFYYLLGGVYKFRRGFAKRHELLYHFHPTKQQAEADAQAAAFQRSVIAMASPEWNCATRAFGRVTPVREDEFPWWERRFRTGVERVCVKRRQAYREYGMMNFGDWYGERRYNWGNMEYDTPFVLLAQSLRIGDPRLFEFGEQASRHNIDVDTVHHSTNPAMVGAAYAHCIGHTGYYYPSGFKPPATPRGGCGPGHMWNRGNFLYHFLTGDPRPRRIAMQLSDHNAQWCTRSFSVKNHASRDHSWPMLTCLIAYDATGDPFYLNGARIIAETVMASQDPAGGSWLYPAGYSKAYPLKLGGYTWCVGLLIMSMDWYQQHLTDPAEIAAVRTCMKRAADWTIRSEWVEEVEGFRATSCPTFNRHTRPGSSCWSASPALVVVAKQTGDKKYLDYALRGYRHLLKGSDGMGKSFSQHVCMSLHMIHDLKQMGITRIRQDKPGAKAAAPTRLPYLAGRPLEVPIVVRSTSLGRIEGQVRVASLPKGWSAAKEALSFKLQDLEDTVALRFVLTPTPTAKAGKVRFQCQGGQEEQVFDVALSPVAKRTFAGKCGLVATGDDFLGPALKKAGVAFERVASVDGDLSPYRVIFLGTQAHTLDSGRVSSRYWQVWRYVLSGGVLVVSQMNDDNWQPFLLPGSILLGEDNSTLAGVAARDCPLFCRPHRIADVAGALMYDHIQSCGPGWKVLATDAEGRPAMLVGRFGHGRIIVCEPSIERAFSGQGLDEFAAKPAHGKLFENLLRYAGVKPRK